MSTSSTVDRAFAAALYAASDAALDTGASLLAADPAADAELGRRGREFVAAAWRRGWQPADVVRLVRRELDDAHVRLAAELILDEHGDRQPPTPRWAAQLEELREAREQPRADRFSHATAVLELYRLLLRLPTLEPLDVRDPHARTAPAHATAPRSTASRMLGRIRALLAKAEATGFPEEAEALSAKAQELMTRYSVDEALIAARARGASSAPGIPGACRVGVDPPYESAKAVLLDAVARANHCQAVWNEALGFSTVVGFEPDLDVVELLYASLLVQATVAMTTAEAAQRAGGRKRTKTFRQSFLAAYAHRIGDRLAAVAHQEQSRAADDAADTDDAGAYLPVLAAREVAVASHLEQLFPDTVTTRLRGVHDAAGWDQGTAAADRAHVEHHRPVSRG
ncbi:protein of unknown function DUF2786 [Actinobacteria bacterium OK074]|nr:protein of unknown function DUF2786 [Actinobacteria bacterium OK074]